MRVPQRNASSFPQWIQKLFADFHLPRPAYALGGLLALGIIVGLGNSMTEKTATADDAGAYVQDITGEGALL